MKGWQSSRPKLKESSRMAVLTLQVIFTRVNSLNMLSTDALITNVTLVRSPTSVDSLIVSKSRLKMPAKRERKKT